MLPVAGAWTEAKLMLFVAGVDQSPKRDFPAVWAAGSVVVIEPELAVPVGVLLKPEKIDVVTVVLLDNWPNIEDLLFEETVGVGAVTVRDGDCPKPVTAVVLPKMGLKLWTGLVSGPDVAGEEVGVMVVTAKMGLKLDAISGLELLLDTVWTAVLTVLESEDAAGALIWLACPNILTPAIVVLEAWPNT